MRSCNLVGVAFAGVHTYEAAFGDIARDIGVALVVHTLEGNILTLPRGACMAG